MKRPQLGRRRNTQPAPAQAAPPEMAERTDPAMAVADPTTEAPDQEAEDKEPVRPKIQTTVRSEDNAAWKAYCESKQLAPNVALRMIIADAIGVTLPAEELRSITKSKYATPEEAKAAAKAKEKVRRDEMAEALKFFREMRAAGKV